MSVVASIVYPKPFVVYKHRDGFYDAGCEKRLGHLQVQSVPEGFRVLEHLELPVEKGFRMPVGGTQSFDVARLRLHNVADAPQRAGQHVFETILQGQFSDQLQQLAESGEERVLFAAEVQLHDQLEQVPQQIVGQVEEDHEAQGRGQRENEFMRWGEKETPAPPVEMGRLGLFCLGSVTV